MCSVWGKVQQPRSSHLLQVAHWEMLQVLDQKIVGLILIFISVLYKGREWAGSASIYPSNILLLRILFFLAFSMTTRAAVWKAPTWSS